MIISIGQHNRKIGAIPSFSLVPVQDCRNCGYCRTDCYALKAVRLYPPTREAWQRNSELARHDPEGLELQLRAWLHARRVTTGFFRIHVAGDFFDQGYLDLWLHIARVFPGTKFLAFTKAFDLDYSRRPPNLSLVFSMWPGLPQPERMAGIHFAWMQDGTEDRIPEDTLPCPGRCEECGMCWTLPHIGQDVVFHKH